ncbi:trypsin-like peptidase domain-containing protein [Arenimonas sp.]|nr:trypsin-like peptidase domain-containing protein [Candidatus Parcubacteria bacterium]
MENNTLDTTKLLSSVRSVGTLKPMFDIPTQSFLPPQLNVLGTGFWVGNSVFVTCAHVVQSLLSGPFELKGMLVVGGNNDQYLKATISILDLEHDLAVLQISNKDFHATRKESCLNLNDEKEVVGEDVCFAGYPLGNQLLNETHTPIFARGVIAHTSSSINKIRKEIKISGFVEGGFSGSPVVNNKGNVIGVVASHPEQTKNIFNIISWEHIVKLIELENS